MPKKDETSRFQAAIRSERPALIAEVCPPASADPGVMAGLARAFAGRVHALSVCDNRRKVQMSALAAAMLASAEGVEPILHVTTRDRNRIALAADGLGAAALGVRNVLCTSGTHQTLGPFRSARNVYDIDSVQLIQLYAHCGSNGDLVGAEGWPVPGPWCVGGVASPFADPLEMQVSRLAKKVQAGAEFLVTQPVFDLERFRAWWQEVTQRKLHENAAILAGVRVLTSASEAEEFAASRPSPLVPPTILERLTNESDPAKQREVGIRIASETVQALQGISGLRGLSVSAEDDAGAALEVIEATGLEVD